MNNVNIVELQLEVRGALTEAKNLGYSTSVYPYAEETPWVPCEAKRFAPVEDFVVMKEDLDTKPLALLNMLKPGETRQLIAGTGVGKTTRMPLVLAAAIGGAALVLCHDDLLPDVIRMYCHATKASYAPNVKCVHLRSSHVSSPVEGPVVYYASASSFLSRLALEPTILDILGVKFVYLDESHVCNPEYLMFRYLVALGKLGSAKVFFGTATAAGDVDMESGGVGRDVVTKSLADFSTTVVENCTMRSPLHYSNIKKRTLVFMANDEECDMWSEYYTAHDTPSFVFGYSSSSERYLDMMKFIEDNPLCVVLTVSRLETSYTLDVDVVVDCGFETVLAYDFDACEVKKVRQPITRKSRTQRIGRVGRHKAGVAYVADVQFSSPRGIEDDVIGMYVYLWSLLLCVKIRDSSVSRFERLLGQPGRKCVSILLHSRLPPFAVAPYSADDGFYVGFAKGMSRTLPVGRNVESSLSESCKMKGWVVRSCNSSSSDDIMRYESRVAVPAGWGVVLYYAWMHYIHKNNPEIVSGSSRSVVSIVESVVPNKKKHYSAGSRYGDSLTFAGNKSSVGNVSVKSPRYVPALDVRSSMLPILEEVQVSDSVSQVGSNRLSIDDIERWTKMSLDARSNIMTPEKKAREKKTRRRSSSSSGSSDPKNLVLVQVDPTKYKMYKLYPMYDESHRVFVTTQTPQDKDFKRYNALRCGDTVITKLGRDAVSRNEQQTSHFLSVLRVHNAAVTAAVQMRNVDSPTSIGKIFFGKNSSRDYERTVDASADLLHAFQIESYFVGVDKRIKHAGTSVFDSPDCEGYASMGSFYVAIGTADLQATVNMLKALSKPVTNKSGKIIGCSWRTFDKVVSVRHLFVNDENNVEVDNKNVILYNDEEKDLLLMTTPIRGLSFFPIAKCKPDMEILLLATDVFTGNFQVLGPFKLNGEGDIWYVDGILDAGYSGALAFAPDILSIVGLYVGFYIEDGGIQYGRITPLYDVWVNHIS